MKQYKNFTHLSVLTQFVRLNRKEMTDSFYYKLRNEIVVNFKRGLKKAYNEGIDNAYEQSLISVQRNLMKKIKESLKETK